MGIHCFRNDAVGLGTLVIVYTMMLIGNILFLFSACFPVFTGEKELHPAFTIELIVFETLWLMMVWSHTYCMCTEPGFIPRNYRYNIDKLPPHFKDIISP